MHERLFCTAPLAILTSPLPHPSPPPLAVPSRVSLPPPASACAPTNYYVRQSLARPFSRSPPRNRSKFLLLTVLTVNTQSVLRTSLAWSLVTVCLSRVEGAGAFAQGRPSGNVTYGRDSRFCRIKDLKKAVGLESTQSVAWPTDAIYARSD